MVSNAGPSGAISDRLKILAPRQTARPPRERPRHPLRSAPTPRLRRCARRHPEPRPKAPRSGRIVAKAATRRPCQSKDASANGSGRIATSARTGSMISDMTSTPTATTADARSSCVTSGRLELVASSVTRVTTSPEGLSANHEGGRRCRWARAPGVYRGRCGRPRDADPVEDREGGRLIGRRSSRRSGSLVQGHRLATSAVPRHNLAQRAAARRAS